MKRLKNQSGFTLAETLLAVLILLLVSGIVASGVPAAQNAYEKVVIGANAQTMLSTAITTLRDELGTAWKVNIPADGKTVTYFNASTGAQSKLSLDEDETRYPAILLQDYVALDEMTALIHDVGATSGDARHMVPDKNTGLYATFDTIQFHSTDPNIIVVSGLAVCNQKDSKVIADMGEDINLEIRLLSENEAA